MSISTTTANTNTIAGTTYEVAIDSDNIGRSLFPHIMKRADRVELAYRDEHGYCILPRDGEAIYNEDVWSTYYALQELGIKRSRKNVVD